MDFEIQPGELKKIPTGLAMALPESTCGRLLSRSGNTINKMVSVEAGVIDADYTGEVQVALYGFVLQRFKNSTTCNREYKH